MKTPSLTKSLPALLTLTGGAALLSTAAQAEAANVAPQPASDLNAIETRVKAVQDKMTEQQQPEQPGVSFAEKSVQTGQGLQTFWWGNWHNGGWGPGFWHNWGNGGWHNWGNGWGNGGWHNWHNWHNW